MYFLNFLDRNAMVNGKINGLSKDLKLKGVEYQTCVSILFVGYLLGQVPSNMVMNRVKPAWWMSGWMMAWAIVSTLNFKVTNYHGLLACRFLLGVTEAPFYPGALFMISLFYNRKEAATRMAVLYTGNMLASSFSGLIAAGVFAGLDNVNGWEGWRWLFLLQGLATILVAIAAFFFLPNSPLETRWLSAEERQLAHSRIAIDTTEKRAGTSTWTGLKEAASDYRLWLFALMCNLHLSANGFKNFLPSVVQTLGFNSTVTLVLTCPPYLFAAVISVLVSWSSGRFNERTWHITISKAVAIVGFILACATLNLGARYFAIMLFVGATYGVNNINIAWTAATLGQTDEKKAVGKLHHVHFSACVLTLMQLLQSPIRLVISQVYIHHTCGLTRTLRDFRKQWARVVASHLVSLLLRGWCDTFYRERIAESEHKNRRLLTSMLTSAGIVAAIEEILRTPWLMY